MYAMLETITDTCPSCGVMDGEPCAKWCDDNWGGVVRNAKRRPTWDDES